MADAPVSQPSPAHRGPHGLPAVAEALWQALQADWPGFSVEVLPEIDSTNTELMRRARGGLCDPVLLVAERQTAGRGRLGRAWASAPGDSLTFSIGVPLAPADWSGLSLAVGVALAEALDPAPDGVPSPLRVGLKWPNDLWLADRKLAGILIETASAGGPGAAPASAARCAVVGIGINLATPEASGLSTPPAGLREIWPDATVAQVLQRVVPAVMQALRAFERAGFGPARERFAARDVLRGRRVCLSDGREGAACGVDLGGELLVQTPTGLERVASSEVSVRPQSGREPGAGPGVQPAARA